jgi:hypothetical protein
MLIIGRATASCLLLFGACPFVLFKFKTSVCEKREKEETSRLSPASKLVHSNPANRAQKSKSRFSTNELLRDWSNSTYHPFRPGLFRHKYALILLNTPHFVRRYIDDRNSYVFSVYKTYTLLK